MGVKLINERRLRDIVKLENSAKVFARNLMQAAKELKEDMVKYEYEYRLENQDASIKILHEVVREGQHIIGIMIHALGYIDAVTRELEKS